MTARGITTVWLADQLRQSAAWLNLAADDLDHGDLEQARMKAWVGSWQCKPIPVDIGNVMNRESAKAAV